MLVSVGHFWTSLWPLGRCKTSTQKLVCPVGIAPVVTGSLTGCLWRSLSWKYGHTLATPPVRDQSLAFRSSFPYWALRDPKSVLNISPENPEEGNNSLDSGTCCCLLRLLSPSVSLDKTTIPVPGSVSAWSRESEFELLDPS